MSKDQELMNRFFFLAKYFCQEWMSAKTWAYEFMKKKIFLQYKQMSICARFERNN